MRNLLWVLLDLMGNSHGRKIFWSLMFYWTLWEILMVEKFFGVLCFIGSYGKFSW